MRAGASGTFARRASGAIPVYVGLAAMAVLCIGLAQRSRVAFVVALAAGGYQLATTLTRHLTGSVVSVSTFEFVSLIPALMVVGGLLASWRTYWQPTR